MIKKIKNLIYKFLRKTQKYTGIDNVYITTQGSYLTIGNIINTLASFLLSMAFARLLPKETYGEYRYLLSIMTVISLVALPGLGDAFLQAIAGGFEGSFKKVIKTKFKWGLLGSLTSLAFAVYLLIIQNPNLAISFLVAAIFLPLMESSEIYLSYLAGKKLFGIQVKYSTITQILAIASIIITLFLTKSLIVLVLVYFLSNTFLRIYFLFQVIKKNPPNKKEGSETISFGKHLSFVRIFHTIASQIDKILLFNILGPVQVAIYSFATLPIREATTFLQNIRLLALPKLVTRDKKEIKKTLLKKVGKATLLIIPLVLLYIIIAPYIYKIFFPQYTESIIYSQLFALTLIAFPASMIALFFQAQMMKKELYQFNIISPLIQIILLIILMPFYGILGIIMAQLIGILFSVCLALFLFRKI
jgi:O-antigen/teichoic acid export membrane protein